MNFSVKRRQFRSPGINSFIGLLATGILTVTASHNAAARSIEFDNGATIEYKVTTTYAAAMRMRNPHGALVDGPVDPFVPTPAPDPAGGRFVGFEKSGLPITINGDDGNRNFRRNDLINNRVSGLGEIKLIYKDFGLIYSGSAFYDAVYERQNANDSPLTVNKFDDVNEFNQGARYYNGKRSRTLEAYAFADFFVLEDSVVSLRIGKHLVAYGESLFLPGVSGAMAPNDATKAFIPGAEIKDILLPVNQFSANFSYGFKLNLFGFYQFDWKPTELFPSGDLFSPADLIGPGATFAYGSANPASGDCPGLLGPLSPVCGLNTFGGPLLNAPRTINVFREDDIRPDDDGQFGGGLRYQLTSITGVGAYYIRYHSHNPTVQLNTGFAFIGETPDGTPVTTEVINQPVPVTYNVKYFDDIELYGLSFTTVLEPFNVGGEIIYRDGIDVQVQSVISGVLSPIFVEGKVWSGQVSALYVVNPRILWYDEFIFVSEAKYLYVQEADQFEPQAGVVPVGDGDDLYNDRNAWGYQFLALLNARNVIPGWDLKNVFAWGHSANGTPSTGGDFGPLFGENDRRAVLGVGMQYLQNLEFAVTYNAFFGSPRKNIRGGVAVKQNPLADRDYITFSIKYNL